MDPRGPTPTRSSNDHGQLGNGTTSQTHTPVNPDGNLLAISISTTGRTFAMDVEAHTCTVLRDASVQCWGINSSGQLGDGTLTTSLAPIPVAGLTNVAEVVTGTHHACALLNNGTARCWGANFEGELGTGNYNQTGSPAIVIGL